jgi:hypothetical protein
MVMHVGSPTNEQWEARALFSLPRDNPAKAALLFSSELRFYSEKRIFSG